MAENADCNEKIEENEQNRLYEMVSELSHTYFNMLLGKEGVSARPYFSKSGIILEGSQIPYIFWQYVWIPQILYGIIFCFETLRKYNCYI